MWLLTFVCSGWCYTKIEDPPPIRTSANELCRLLQLRHMLFRRVNSSASMTTAVLIHLQLQVLLTYPHPTPSFLVVKCSLVSPWLLIIKATYQSANHFGPHKTHLTKFPMVPILHDSSSPGAAGPWSPLLPTSHPSVRNPGPHTLRDPGAVIRTGLPTSSPPASTPPSWSHWTRLAQPKSMITTL